MAQHKIGFYNKNNQKYFFGLVPIDSMIRKSISHVGKVYIDGEYAGAVCHKIILCPSSSRRGVLTGLGSFP